jgi:hypothetical protein
MSRTGKPKIIAVEKGAGLAAGASQATGRLAAELKRAELAERGTVLRGEAREKARAKAGELASRTRSRAQELADRVAASDAVAQARTLAADIAEDVRDGDAAERARELATVKSHELAEALKSRLDEAGVDERLQELYERLRQADGAERVGDWLTERGIAERFDLDVPTSKDEKGGKLKFVLLLLAAAAAGWYVLQGRKTAEDPLDDPFVASAERLAAAPPPAPAPVPAPAPAQGSAGSVTPGDTSFPPPSSPSSPPPAGTAAGASPAPATAAPAPADPAPAAAPAPQAAPSAPPAPKAASSSGGAKLSVADEVRAKLAADGRTSSLTGLAVNVAEGTVFVRGTVPSGTDEDGVRDVVAGVDGVQDVDLQVTQTG